MAMYFRNLRIWLAMDFFVKSFETHIGYYMIFTNLNCEKKKKKKKTCPNQCDVPFEPYNSILIL